MAIRILGKQVTSILKWNKMERQYEREHEFYIWLLLSFYKKQGNGRTFFIYLERKIGYYYNKFCFLFSFIIYNDEKMRMFHAHQMFEISFTTFYRILYVYKCSSAYKYTKFFLFELFLISKTE